MGKCDHLHALPLQEKVETNEAQAIPLRMFFSSVVMKIRRALAILVFTARLVLPAALFAGQPLAYLAPSSAFDTMKTLMGLWEGTAREDGTDLPKTTRFQMVAGSTVLAGWLNEGTPHEMVTMFHMDGNDLMATHYCAAHNQPRMVLVSGNDPSQLVFKFKDGTNIRSGSGHMQQVTFIFDGATHHLEDWIYIENGREQTTRFDFRRKQ